MDDEYLREARRQARIQRLKQVGTDTIKFLIFRFTAKSERQYFIFPISMLSSTHDAG